MTFSIRPVLTHLGLVRPDVESAFLLFAAQEGVRSVCRRTHLAVETFDWTIDANTNAIQIAMPAGQGFLRVMNALFKGASDANWAKLEEVSALDALDARGWIGGSLTQGSFSQQGGTVIIYPTPAEAGVLRGAVSYVPTDDFEQVPLPEQATPAVTNAALGIAYAVPGQAQNLQAAADHQRRFDRSIGGLRAMAFIGEGGSPSFSVTPFM